MRGYRADIDGLRAISVLAVVLFHAGLGLPGGFIGVDVFFVISGFLITRLIVDGLASDSFTLSGFWERRIRRIWPAALVTTAVSLVVGWWLLLPRDYRDLGGDAIAQMFMASNVRYWLGTDYFAPASDFRALLHMWSLAVEEQFYLFYPSLLVILWRFARHRILPVLIGLTAVSFAASALAVMAWPAANFYLLPFRAWELQMGGVLALSISDRIIKRGLGDLLTVLGLLIIVLCALLYDRTIRFPGLTALPVCLGAAMAIAGAGAQGSVAAKVLGCGVLRSLGQASYSLYLIHWPLLAFLRYRFGVELPITVSLGVVVVSVLGAFASFRWLETPMRQGLRSWRLGKVTTAAIICTSLPLAIAVAVRQSGGFPERIDPAVANFHSRQELPNRWVQGSSKSEISAVPIGVESANELCPCFLFLGDSHAMAISLAIHESAMRMQLQGEAFIYPAFPPLLGVWRPADDKPGDDFQQHEAFDVWLMENVERCHPKHIVLCARWSVYIPDGDVGSGRGNFLKYGDFFRIEARGGSDSARETPSEAMTRALQILLDATSSYGTRIWILLEVPQQDVDPQRRAIQALHSGSVPLSGVSMESHRARTSRVFQVIASMDSPRLRVVDLAAPFFGLDGLSRTGRGEVSWYFDADHVSTSGAREVLGATIDDMIDEMKSDCGLPPDS